MDKVGHFEIPADDTDRASAFYKKIFNWEIMPMPEMKYTILRTGPTDENNMPKEAGFISGGMMERSSDIPGPIIMILVGSIDDSLKAVVDEGGSVVKDKITVGDMGFVAYFKDTEGNVLGMWEEAKKD